VPNADIKGHQWGKFVVAVDYIRYGYIMAV